MKDCTTCKDRLELNPQYADAEWDDIPCSACKITEPPRHGTIEYREYNTSAGHDKTNAGHDKSFITKKYFNPYESRADKTDRSAILMEYLRASRSERAEQRINPPNKYVAAFVGRFHPWREDDVIDSVVNWHKFGAENARHRERSRVAQFKAMKKLDAIIESMGEPVRFELGGE